MRPSATPSLTALRCLGILLLVLGLGGCKSWTPLRKYDGWTLYVKEREALEIEPYEASLSAAFDCVEDVFGPFEGHVRVHAWEGGVRMESGSRGNIHEGSEHVHHVEGIGPARVQGFHARGGGPLLFRNTGVFVGTSDAGTATHELVHARLAEIAPGLPLWFEEGLAGFLGDGAFFEGRWVVDGLACWPLRELRDETLDDDVLRRLLAIRPTSDQSLRENVLVHFIGWAVVFDLYVEDGRFAWEDWIARYGRGMALEEVRARVARTLDADTPARWLERLKDADPGKRYAAVRGIWKLRDTNAVVALYQALETEKHPEVLAAFTINGVACAGEMRLPWPLRRRLSRRIAQKLRLVELEDENEQQALRTLYISWRSGRRSSASEGALDTLRRFWAE